MMQKFYEEEGDVQWMVLGSEDACSCK